MGVQRKRLAWIPFLVGLLACEPRETVKHRSRCLQCHQEEPQISRDDWPDFAEHWPGWPDTTKIGE
jgi:hypothetical protein